MIRVLGISKSTLYYKSKDYPQRQPRSRKEFSEDSKNAIFEITGKKSTYGCPRVRAILKRDYRIIKIHGSSFYERGRVINRL